MAADMIIGNYRITRKIGAGGMGAVYAAEHKLLGSQAAIKVLLPEWTKDPQIRKRFHNEAKAATRIKHPGIVEVYDFGERDDGSTYIAMEYLEGEDLAARLRRLGRIPVWQAVLFAEQVCSALQAAHSHGIIHRDLKPGNIFLVPDPQVDGGERIKLLDFGIAKFSADNDPSAVMTKAGSLMGTPSYMAPEQCMGAANVDQRADLYSLGCILYEMLCGRPPFAGAPVDVMTAQMRDVPPTPRSLQPEVTAELDAAIMQALAKAPEERFQSANQFEGTLRALMGVPMAMVTDRSGSVPFSRSYPVANTPVANTLDSATNASTQNEVPRSRWVIPTASLVTLMAVGAAYALYTQTAVTPDQPVVIDAAPPPPPPPEPKPLPDLIFEQEPADGVLKHIDPEDDSLVTWRLRSKPTGAEVRQFNESGQEDLRGNTATPLWVGVEINSERTERFILRLAGYGDKVIDLTADADFDQEIVLDPLIEVTLQSRPRLGAQVYLPDGTYNGNTPLKLTGPRGSELIVILKLNGYEDEQVEIKFDKPHKINPRLTKAKPRFTIKIESNPSGAEVWQGDVRLGKTPYEDQLPQTTWHEFLLKHDGCQDAPIKLSGRRNDSKFATLTCK